MEVYVTGGTGFIGSYVINELAQNGYKTTILARNPDKVPLLKKVPYVRIKKFNLNNLSSFFKSVKKIDAFIHVALGWGDTGPEMIKKETLPAVTLIDSVIKKGAKKIIFTSSTAAIGPIASTVNENTRCRPSDFYGATKGSVELFMSAYSNYHKNLRLNVVRPGYTFGNPVVAGASIEPDDRFRDICRKARHGKKITLIKNDGTQFIWAGDLAKIYLHILNGNCKNEIFFGLSRNFITWEQIAKWAFEMANKKPDINLINKGWSDNPPLYDVSKIKNYFGLSFNAESRIKEHIKYLLEIS
ncbi:MAG: NAD(P)-dependent oxidoreductase [Candidatus Goldbacteria bacterium]|nr:NAD(P)-dependent oxidoreductase [Candidatus Goldiibacteriota bacterium]